jgi:hypothetical protein
MRRSLGQAWPKVILVGCLSALLAAGCAGDEGAGNRASSRAGGNGGSSDGSVRANPPTVSPSDLYVDPGSYDFTDNPALLDRILGSPHGYFRFINREFSAAVCEVWEEMARVDSIPRNLRVNLHGDAHLEQYAITDLGRGLTDFDDSSQGPAAVDLVRFATSLRLTAIENGWEAGSDDLIRAFMDGYAAALEDPERSASEPMVVARAREDFTEDREAYYEWVDSVLDPLSAGHSEGLTTAIGPYVDAMLQDHLALEPSYFEVISMGSLGLGIGSALDRKYVVRFRGPTDDPLDDEVIEIKEVRDLSGIGCIIASKDDPFRVLLGQARIAYRPFRLLGYVRFDGKTFWVHAWVPNYHELSVEDSFETSDELREVAYDVGVQLGLGHVRDVAAPFDRMLREGQLALVRRYRDNLLTGSTNLAADVTAAWERFSQESARLGLQPGGQEEAE